MKRFGSSDIVIQKNYKYTKNKFMKKIFFSIFILTSTIFSAQVGVNTESPKASLDVAGKPGDASAADGIVVPRLTGDQLKAKDAVYTVNQNGTIVYVTQPVSTASPKTVLVNEQGLYFYDSIQTKWRKLITGVPLTVQAFNGQRVTTSITTIAINATRTLDFPQTNILPTADIGSWNSTNTIFTVNKKGVYTIYAGTAMENSSSTATGAMSIIAGVSSFVGGSQLTIDTSSGLYYVNCSGVFSGLLNVGDQIYVIATSGNTAWKQGKSFMHIIYSEI